MQRQYTSEDRTASGKDEDSSVVGVPSHPIAATIGALAAGGATGAVVGTAAGPVGTAVGAVVGAIAGALGGDAVASAVDQASESGHWRETHASRPYVATDTTYDDYSPAYLMGEGVRKRYPAEHFDSLDEKLAAEWVAVRRESRLDWNQARPAAREAWERTSS